MDGYRTPRGRVMDGLDLTIARFYATTDGWTGTGDQVYPHPLSFMMLSSHDSVTLRIDNSF